MAGLFGGVPTPGSSIKELDHVAIGTSSQGKPVPIVYGTTRIAGNVIWMPKELWQKVAGQPAGKGGVDAGSQDTYYQGVAIAICEGPVTLGRVWRDKEVFATLADVETGTPFSFLSGTRSQSPWSFFGTGQIRVSQVQQTLSGTTVTLASTTTDVSTVQIRDVDSTWRPMVRVAPGSVVAGTYSVSGNVVTFDSGDGGLIVRISYVTNSVVSGWSVGYGGTAHVATSRLNLGNSNSLKNFSWEVNGFVGSGDVNPADVVYDFLTNTEYGCGWPTTDVEVDLGQDGSSASGYRRYCAQAGLLLSPAFEEQKNALEHVKWVLDASNSEILPTADGKIRIIPLGDTAVGTYTPNTTPAYSLNEDNFVCEIDGNGNPTTDPITVERRSQEDTYNCHPVEFLEKNPTTDATAAYTAVPYEDFDQGDVEASGGEVRKKEAVSLHCITNRNVAQVISRIRAQRDVYIRNKYTFRLGWQFGRIEPLDLLQISESTFGISNLVVRVTSVEEDEFGTLTITAEDWPFGVASAASYTTQTSEGGGQDHGADPLISNAPAIVVPPQEATADGVTPEVWIAASGGSKDWAGAEVWISWDNATFSYVSDVFPGTYGQLSNALAVGSPNDTTNTLRADLRASGGSLSSVTSAAKDALESLCWVDGELVSYQTASLVTTNVYDLTVLRRGVKGTVASSHPIGGKFVRLDDKVLRIPISADRFGSTLYVKLRAFNLSRTVVNDLATIPVYKTTLPSKGTVAPVVASSVRVSFDDFDLSDWDLIGNVQGSSLSLQNSTITGSKVLQAIGNVQLLHKALIPYDPNKTYKLLARYQQTALPSIAANIYFGFVGVQADGVTPVDETGTTGNFFSAHYLYAVTPAVDGWHTLQGYWKGRGSTNGSDGNGTTATAPAVAQATVKFVRLLMYLNNPSSGTAPADGTQQIDTLEFFDVNESSAYVGPPLVTAQIANDAVTAAKILDGEVGTNKIANLAVVNGKLADSSVSAAKMQANSILAKHLVLTDFENLCTNPSGDVGDVNGQIPAGWIGGQGSASNILLDTTNRGNPTGTNVFAQGDRDAYFGQWFPIAPNDQFWCSVDAKPDTTGTIAQAGFSLGIQLADNPAGSNPAWQTGSTVGDKTVNAWQSLSGTVTIGGAETRKYARVWTLINTTAGATGRWWFRNTSVRRKNGGNLTVDGSITASKLSVSTLSAIAADLGTITAGLIKNSAGSTKFDVANGRIVFNNGTVMCASGIGFGSSSQFIYWIGPSTGAAGAEDLSLCTEANAKFFVKTDGTVKFAGILQVGQTVNGASGTVLTSANIADLGPFTSAGGTITINTQFAFHGQVNFAGTTAGLTSYNATTKQSPNIVLVLSRSINGGAFSDVATYTPSSSHSETAPIPASSDPGIYEQFSNGSWTYTDSAHLAQNREFKVRITTFSSINSTVDQNTIAIQSIE